MRRGQLGAVAPLPGPIPLISVVLLISCGPSFESVYEGNLRFEHCYRLDHDPGIGSSPRESCWNEWVRVYTFGQTLDRLEYAKRRLRVLRGEPPPGASAPAPDTQSTDPAGDEVVATATPALTSAESTTGPVKSSSDPPQVICSRSCEATLLNCKATCQVAPKGCAPCEPQYKACEQRCIE